MNRVERFEVEKCLKFCFVLFLRQRLDGIWELKTSASGPLHCIEISKERRGSKQERGSENRGMSFTLLGEEWVMMTVVVAVIIIIFFFYYIY